jgi:hypothetical protein
MMARWIPRFSLRTLILLLSFIGVVAGYHGIRYAKLQERLTAKRLLENYGFTFQPRSSTTYPNLPAVEELVDLPFNQWDRWWFSSAELELYEGITYSPSTHDQYQNVREQPRKEALPALVRRFPELVRVTAYLQTEHAFAPLPNLRKFYGHAIDAAWVAALPEHSPLRDLNAEHRLPPESMALLLRRCPQLQYVRVHLNELDAEVVELLNRLPQASSRPTRSIVRNDFQRLPHRHQLDYEPKEAGDETRLREMTAGLKVDYLLRINAEYLRRRLDLSGCNMPRLHAAVANLVIHDCPNLTEFRSWWARTLKISNCPRLEHVDANVSKEAEIAQLPTLRVLQLTAPVAWIRACPQLAMLATHHGDSHAYRFDRPEQVFEVADIGDLKFVELDGTQLKLPPETKIDHLFAVVRRQPETRLSFDARVVSLTMHDGDLSYFPRLVSELSKMPRLENLLIQTSDNRGDRYDLRKLTKLRGLYVGGWSHEGVLFPPPPTTIYHPSSWAKQQQAALAQQSPPRTVKVLPGAWTTISVLNLLHYYEEQIHADQDKSFTPHYSSGEDIAASTMY